MSNPAPARPSRRRRPGGKRPAANEIWRVPGALPELEPVTVPQDVRALIRSLGDAPMSGSTIAGDHFDRVVERTASVAAALALSAGLLAGVDDDAEVDDS